jgi:hypothetical protein
MLYTYTYISSDPTILVYNHSTTFGSTSIHASLNIKISDLIAWLYKHIDISLLWRIQVYMHIQT